MQGRWGCGCLRRGTLGVQERGVFLGAWGGEPCVWGRGREGTACLRRETLGVWGRWGSGYLRRGYHGGWESWGN